jgi:hypothetical protein
MDGTIRLKLLLSPTLYEDGRVRYIVRSTEEDRWIAPHFSELTEELECHISSTRCCLARFHSLVSTHLVQALPAPPLLFLVLTRPYPSS